MHIDHNIQKKVTTPLPWEGQGGGSASVVWSALRILIFVCALAAASAVWAQPNAKRLTVEGRVEDVAAQPLSDVVVQVLPHNAMTETDGYGRYRISAAKGDTLRFICLGFDPQLVVYRGEARLDVTMRGDKTKLETVTVKARPNINAIDIRAKSGVVGTVDMEQLNAKPMIDMGVALQGAVPGLQIVNTGELGSAPKIRIRGNSSLRKDDSTNEPLYVLDGLVISAETFYNLNPADIKDIKVLKDAAACALYGVKAANGVIEMTSQRGGSDGVSVNYSFNMGVTAKGRRGVSMMGSDEKLELERLLQNPAAPGYRYSEDYYNRYYGNDPALPTLIASGRAVLDSLRAINTDWFDELIRTNVYQKHSVSVKGGDAVSRYYISLDYTKQGGRIRGNDKDRIGARMNLDRTLGKLGYLMLGVNGDVATTHTPVGTSSDPTQLVYDLNPYETRVGELFSLPGQTFGDLMNQYQREESAKSFGASANLTLTPVDGLDVAALVGIDYMLGESEQFTPSTAYSETHTGVPANKRGVFSKSKNTTANISSNIRLNYSHTFGERHDLTLGANMDYYQTRIDNVGITGYGVGQIKSAAAINQSIQGVRQASVSGAKDKTAQMGLGVVGGYTFDDTYDLFATYKADASSVLPADKRWNKAWAVGAGWTPTHYAWLKENPVVTHLNLKATYGCTANLNGVSASTTVGTFSYSNRAYEEQRPLGLISIYNTDLKPEQTKQLDLGGNVEWFHRVTFDINFYDRRTEQALLDVPIPTSTGYSMLKRNIGVLDNKGFELGLDVKVVNTVDWQLSLYGNMAFNRNKVVALYYTDKIYASEQSLVPDYEVGKSYDMIYGPQSLGINPLTGYPVFITNGVEKQASEVLTAADVVALGYSTPPYSGSFGLRAYFREWELSMQFYYVHGGINQFNYTYVRDRDSAIKNAVEGQTQRMWFHVGDEGKIYPTPYYTSATAEDNLTLYPNTLTVGKSDYLRLSQVSLRYRMPDKLLHRLCPIVKYANFSLQASNLYTWTHYNEADPESGKMAGSLQPVMTFNMNLTF